MGTTLDSLQIKIQSSSTDAAKSIDDLATSLGKLKSNGAFKAVSTNLERLSEALGKLPNVHQSSNALRTLANSIEKLKSVGTVSSLANSLKKLPEALKTVATIDLDRVSPKIKELAESVVPLSQVKAGGLSTMVNAIKNLGKLNFDDVAKNLDDTSIKNFTDRVAVLNEKLGPLSTKMATIKSGFSAINSNARAAASGVKEFSEDVDTSALNLSNFIDIVRTAIDVVQNLVQQFTEFISQAIEWDGISARFGRGFAGEASETYAWIQRLNEEMGINIQEFMKYSSVYSTMLTGFGVAAEDAGKMALGYMELTYDIWAGYNDVYGSLEETAEAVKSAIAGEVEPVRRAGFTIVEATLAQTAANHGLEISLANATEAQKSYLRYLTLIDQAHAQGLVGTYAKELNTAEGLMRTLAQQLKSLTQAFGSLFLPILVKVLPYVQAFVELLTEGVQALAALFGITIQGVDWGDYNSGASDAIENTESVGGALGDAAQAAKELKNATLGLDELNVISPPSATSGSGSAGGGTGGGGFENLDIESLWDESIFKDINSQVDELKEKLKSWLPIIEVIGAAFAAWGLLSLIQSAGEAMEKIGALSGVIGNLKKMLTGALILTIEAALVFMLSDEYLESGNLMALLGEGLATAAGGFLMYKGFGAKGLVMALGVSMIAQLAAITLNLADGGVEMSDPQLWIQSAFTAALGGVAGGFMAYKGLIKMSTGKGVGIGLLAGISLTLAAITIGEVTANGDYTTESILTGIGSIVAAAGFGFAVGGVWGLVIGGAVGLVLNIAGAEIGKWTKSVEESLEKDLSDRFGSITLDKESVKVYVQKLTAIPREVSIDTKVWDDERENFEYQSVTVSVSAALDVYATEIKSMKNFKEQVYKSLETLDALNIKIAVGVEVTQDEYTRQINNFVESAQSYLDQYYLTANVSLGILESNSSAGLSNALASFYATNSAELVKLGQQLKSTVSEAFVDGEWIPDKLQEALELQQEMQEILDYVSEVEYRATMQNFKLSISGNALTADSFKDVLKGATEAIEERLNTLEEVKMSQLQVAVMEYDANIAAGKSEAEAQKIYKQTVADIEKAYQDGRVEVTYGTVDFGLDTLHEAFAEEIAKAESEGWFDYSQQLSDVLRVSFGAYEGDDDTYNHLNGLVTEISNQMGFHTATLSAEARKNLKELLKALEPTMTDYEDLAAESRKTGTTVLSSIRDGLNDYNELKAIQGNADAIKYMIGQGFSTDTKFLNTLATAENAGKQIDKSVAEGLLNNITYVTDEATGVVTGIKNSVTGEVIAVTPTLVQNMKDLGVNLSTGVLEGAETEMKSNEKSWKDWAIWPWNWFKDENEIHSPSKLFERGGKYLVQGLLNGIGDNPLTEKLSEIWGDAKSWWNDNKELASAKVKLVKDGWTTVKGWIGSIPAVSQTIKLAKSGWTSVKGWIGSIASLSQKIGLKKDGWKSVKDWVGKISTLSQGIKLAKSGWSSVSKWIGSMPSLSAKIKLAKSGWSSIKSWLGSLDFKLNFKLPKIGVNWGSREVLGFKISYPTSFYTYAKGGFPKEGEFFLAREAGPEMVGQINGRSAVANNDQIVEAISEGVYAAVTAAMKGMDGSGGTQAVNVYLDGKVVARSVEKAQRERGATIMGSEVYSY
jgi:hypothetical protein